MLQIADVYSCHPAGEVAEQEQVDVELLAFSLDNEQREALKQKYNLE